MKKKSIEYDRDSSGNRLAYHVELWQYPDFRKVDPVITYHTFHKKKQAEKFVQERFEQLSVAIVKVEKLTYKDYLKPPERKIIYTYDDMEENL